MNKTLLHRLFGFGKIPKKFANTLSGEGMILIEEGIGGSITLKKFKAPGRRHSWKRNWFTGSLVLTEKTFAGFSFFRPVIFVPFSDKRFSVLNCGIEKGTTLLVGYDASHFNEKWSGEVECRFKTSQARTFLDHLNKRKETI